MNKQSVTYAFVKKIALGLMKKFSSSGIYIHPQSELGKTIDAGIKLSDNWDLKQSGQKVENKVFEDLMSRAMCCLRLGDSALLLDHTPPHIAKLKEFNNGSLMFWNNEQSKAKDTEYEVYTWARFKFGGGIVAKLLEPDVQIYLDRYYGIACKRLYSIDKMDSRISEGVHQLKRHNLNGIVAISIDSLIQPDYSVARLSVSSISEATGILQSALEKIFELKRDYIGNRYFKKKRLMGIMLTAQAYADIADQHERLFHVHESLIWDNNRELQARYFDEIASKARITYDIIESKLKDMGL